MCHFKLRQKVSSKQAAESLRNTLESAFFTTLRRMETAALDALQQVYRHQDVDHEVPPLSITDDLFDTHQWALWGLGRRGLAITGAATGALLGVGADLASAGPYPGREHDRRGRLWVPEAHG